jgi:hypothetical protein
MKDAMKPAMRFSERYGYRPVREVIQIDSIDEELKNGLWSVLEVQIWDNVGSNYDCSTTLSGNPEIKIFCQQLWFNYFKKPLDTLGNDWARVHSFLRTYFFNANGSRSMTS